MGFGFGNLDFGKLPLSFRERGAGGEVGRMLGKANLIAALALTVSCTPQSQNLIEINYMAWGNPQQLELEQKLCDEFNAANPGIRVKLFKVPGSAYGNKMIVMLASRTAPDVMRVDHYNFPALVQKDYFLPMDELIANDPEFSLDDFFEVAVDEGRYKGKLYGMNVLFGSIVMYYNKTMVQKAGLEDPFELWKKGEWTWDRYLGHAKKMTKKRPDGRFDAFGAAMPEFPTNFACLFSFGAEIMDPTSTRVTAGSGEAVEAWEFFHDLRYVHQAAPSPSQGANAVFTFDSGKIGMSFDWMGMTPRYRETIKDFEWDTCPIPKGKGGDVAVLKGNQLVISAETKHPEAAWKWVKFITSEKVERLLARNRRSFPTRKAVAYSDDYLKSDQPPFNMRAFTYAVETGKPFPITSRWGEWTREFRSGLDNLLAGRTPDIAAAAKEAEDRANGTLAVKEGL